MPTNLLLLAGKYGTVHPKTGKSYTQMEYEYAKEKGVPVIFLTYKDEINCHSVNVNQIQRFDRSWKSLERTLALTCVKLGNR